MSEASLDIPGLDGFLKRAGQSAASARLRAAGLPNRRLEAWRYTPVKMLHDKVYAPPEALSGDIAKSTIPSLPPLMGQETIFLNGSRLTEDTAHEVNAVRHHGLIDAEGAAASSPMGLLNAALRQPGLNLAVPEGVDAGVMSLATVHDCKASSSTHLYHRIDLAPGAKLVLLDYACGRGTYLSNPFFEISLGAGAQLAHVRVIEDDIASETFGVVDARIASDASYANFTLVSGAGLSRQEVYADLVDEGGQVHINGAQLLGTGQVGDMTSVITHSAPRCQSRQTVANVLYGNGRGVFQGKVVVKPHAQKTDGFQMNQALLLSAEAEIDSKPELEIYADDVKCSHGATVGALDDDQLFYLRTRGIPEAQARDMLVEAFLTEVIALAPSQDVIPFLQERVALFSNSRARS